MRFKSKYPKFASYLSCSQVEHADTAQISNRTLERCLTLCLLTWFPCLIEPPFLARKAMGHAIFHFSLYIIKDWIIDTHEQSIQHLFLSKEKHRAFFTNLKSSG